MDHVSFQIKKIAHPSSSYDAILYTKADRREKFVNLTATLKDYQSLLYYQ